MKMNQFLTNLFKHNNYDIQLSQKPETTYQSFRDYIEQENITVYIEDKDLSPLRTIGRRIETHVDAYGVDVYIQPPFDADVQPMMDEYKAKHHVQFDGVDLCLLKTPLPKEEDYVPLDIVVHLNQFVTDNMWVKIPIAYGVDAVEYHIPCQKLAKQAVQKFISTQKVLEEPNSLLLSRWVYDNGELHVYTTLQPTIVSKMHFRDATIDIRYTPYPAFVKRDDHMELTLSMHPDECEEIAEQFAPGHLYERQYYTANIDGIDELWIDKQIKPELFPEDYEVVRPFAEYLNSLGFNIDEELIYEYFAENQMVGAKNG